MIVFHTAQILHYITVIQYIDIDQMYPHLSWCHLGRVFVVAIYSIHLGAGVSPAAQHLGLLKNLPTTDSEGGKASTAKA